MTKEIEHRNLLNAEMIFTRDLKNYVGEQSLSVAIENISAFILVLLLLSLMVLA